MAYSVHNFEQGDILYASQLNEMDAQIALNEENISTGISADMLAEEYSANKTYSIGDYVIYNDELYVCIYEITAPEGWNSAHWQIANLGDGISNVKNALNALNQSVLGEILFTAIINTYVATASNPGDFKYYSGWSCTGKLSCSGLDTITVSDAFEGSLYNAWYDSNENCINNFSLVGKQSVPVPANAAYFAISQTDAQMANLRIYSGESLAEQITDTRNLAESKVASVNHIFPDENGNVTININPANTNGTVGAALSKSIAKKWYQALVQTQGGTYLHSYVDNKLESVPDGGTFVFVTDTHDCKNMLNSYPLIAFYDSIFKSVVLFGGDVLDFDLNKKDLAEARLGVFADGMRGLFGGRFLPTYGNHDNNMAGLSFTSGNPDADFNNATIANTIIPYLNVYNKFIGEYSTSVVLESDLDIRTTIGKFLLNTTIDQLDDATLNELMAWHKLHYYYDDHNDKIRFIVMNKADGISPIMRKYYGDNRLLEVWLQFNWLYQTLNSTPDDYHIVLCGHSIIDYHTNTVESTVYDPSSVNQPMMKVMELLSLCKQNLSGNIVVKYQAVAPNGGWPASTFDFTSHNRTGKILCVCGHSHWDSDCVVHTVNGVYQSDAYTDQLNIGADGILCVMTHTDALGGSMYDKTNLPANSHYFEMTQGTTTEQAFDIVTITQDKVTFTRIGAGDDRVYNY